MKYLVMMVAGLIVTLSSFSSLSGDYDKLWKSVEKKAASHPKQALGLVEEIYAKALQENRDDQLIKAILYKQRLRAQFEDREQVDYIIEAESELDKIDSAAARAVYFHLLGKMYHQYGMANQYRFSGRTEVEDENGEATAFSTLESIQQKAIDYFKASLEIPLEGQLSSIALLTEKYEEGHYLEALNLEQLIAFSAVRHFKDTRSLISLPTDAFAFSDKQLFDYGYTITESINTIDSTDYAALTMAVFQKAKELNELSVEQKVQLEILRLDFLRNNSVLSDKNIHYVAALERLIVRFEGQTGVEPAYCKLISHYLQEGDRTRNQASLFDYDPYQKAAELIAQLESTRPDKKYKETINNFNIRLNQVEVSLSMEKVYVPSENILGALKYRNLGKVKLKVYQLTPQQYELYLQLHNDYKKIKKHIDDYALIEEKELTIPSQGDNGFHSTEFSLEPKDYGHYLIIAEDEKSKVGKAVVNFHISNLAYVANQGGIFFHSGYVMDRTTGAPLEDVTVEVMHTYYNPSSRKSVWRLLESVKTDSKGGFNLTKKDQRFACRIVNGEDVLDLRDQHYQRYHSNQQSYHQVRLFTDRAIYRPGQLVYFKGLVTEINEQIPSIAPDQKIEVIFRDANWQEISKQAFFSNEYGTFNGTVTAPESGLNGRMTLEMIVPYSSRNRYQHNIRVEEYKRPKIYAEFEKLKNSPKLGDTVTVEGQVFAFSGAPISSAKYKYRVEKTQNRWYGYRAGRGFSGYNPSVQQVAFGESTTDENGQFTFQVPTTASPHRYHSYSYVVHVDIVDASGESTTVSKSINLSNKAFRLVIGCPLEGFVGELDSISVMSINAEGQPVEASISLSLAQLQTPESFKRDRYWNVDVDQQLMSASVFSQLFPKDKWTEVDPEGQQKTTIFSNQAYSSNSSQLLQDLESGIYELTITATNADGIEVEEKRRIEISEKSNKALPTKALWTGKLQESYQPEDKLVWDLATPFGQAAVLYRIYTNEGDLEVNWKRLPENGLLQFDITEAHRGGFTIDLFMVKDNRVYGEKVHIQVPWTHKEIQIEYLSFRDKLEPGQEEEWTLKFTDKEGKAITGELAAALYDASLDQFATNSWLTALYPNKHAYGTFRAPGFEMISAWGLIIDRVNYSYNLYGISPWISMQGYSGHHARGGRQHSMMRSKSIESISAVSSDDSANGDISIRGSRPSAQVYYIDGVRVKADKASSMIPKMDLDSDNNDKGGFPDDKRNAADDFSLRENLNETVFFFPDVEINSGEATLSFKMNEALTKWNLLLFAHNKELQYTFDQKEIITQKKLMIEPLLPRFVRQGDEIVLTAKVSNLTEQSIEANSEIIIVNAITGQALNAALNVSTAVPVSLAPGTSEIVSWSLDLPKDFLAPLLVKTLVRGGHYTDGEQNVLPVLTNRKLVTETMPMHIAGGETKTFEFRALNKLGSTTSLTPHNYSLEFTSNPSWIVAKAIPQLTIDADFTSTISYANAIYGNLLMQHLLKEQPALRDAIRLWKDEDLTSELEKKADLKLSELTETPWVRAALGETDQMKKLKLYLDDNYITQQVNTYLRKLQTRQLSNGGFTWMTGGRDNWYVTQNVLETIGHLKKLGVEFNLDPQLIERAVQYCDQHMIEYYEDNGRRLQKYLPATILNYLYVRSFFDLPVSGVLAKATKFYYKKGEAFWTELGTYRQGLLALAAHRSERSDLAGKILSSLEDRLVRNEELGYYWNDQAGYYWYNLNIEKQALMIELFSELKPNTDDLDGLRLFLLKNKQTNSWKTSKATAAACYAFLLGAESWLSGTELVEISYPQSTVDLAPVKPQNHTGYYRQDVESSLINKSLSTVEVKNPNPGVAWGATYFQYFEDLDKITDFEDTPAQITKTVYKVGVDNNGEVLTTIGDENSIQPGDRLRIQIKLSVDRSMEFMQLKDMRSSGLEPTSVISQYKWQDGLGYYESTRDVASYFFFDRIAKGNYVFEYDVFAVHQGTFSNGITEFQSMYAPEFSSHSDGIQIEITKP